MVLPAYALIFIAIRALYSSIFYPRNLHLSADNFVDNKPPITYPTVHKFAVSRYDRG